MQKKLLISAVLSSMAASAMAAEELETVTVNADLRNAEAQDVAASVAIQTQSELQDQGATHFDDILLKTPNVNFSGETSRARHIQIRGLGEREEYTGAPNASVGFAIDGIDYSGIGMASSLFDVKQVEVLKGPQNVRYGQSAIGGLILVESNDPTAYREGMVEASRASDNLTEVGLVQSGPLGSEPLAPQYRFSLFKHSSDGFRKNRTLDRNDTNGKDEFTAKAALRLFPDDKTTVDLKLLHANYNNGYDMWATDNGYDVYSNQPGKDSLKTDGLSLKVASQANPNFTFMSKTSLAVSKMEKSYDGDWNDSGVWDWFYQNFKERQTLDQEIRWTSTENSRLFNDSTDWLSGLYASSLNESNENTSYGTRSYFTHNKLAGFAQLDFHSTPKTTISSGLRVEHNKLDYDNQVNNFTPSETLWGAHLTYSYRYNDTHTAYTGVTRGFKAGGFNADFAGEANEQYDSETLYNYEIGLKSSYQQFGLKTALVAFYMDRYDAQFDGYTAPETDLDPWLFYTENFDRAQNYGLEGSFDWQAAANWKLYGSLGLIKTEVDGTSTNYYVVSGREQAHAPSYQLNLGFKYRNPTGFFAQADVTAVDSFYFDNVHNFQSDAYELVNARLGYETDDYEIYLWGKNLTDKNYAVRGFYFDMDGDKLNDKFYGLGSPRQIGATVRVYF